MSAGGEWDGQVPDGEELLAAGRPPRTPQWLQRLRARTGRVPLSVRWVVAAAVAAAVMGIAYAGGPAPHRSNPAAGPTSSASTQAADSDQSGDWNLAMIVAKAHQPGLLADYVRSVSARGACTLVPIGHSPEHAIAAVLRRVLPQYTVRDASRTLDEFTALCALDLRAVDGLGSTVVIEVVAPHHPSAHPFTAVNIQAQTDPSTTAALSATALNPAGWSVTVGAVGPSSDQPPPESLLELAQDPSMTW